MANSALSFPGNGVSFVPGTIVPPNGAVVTNGSSTTLAKSDNSGNLGTVALNVSGGSLLDVALPANKAVLTDQQSAINVNQYDNSGSTAVSVAVAANTQTLTLANATARFVFNAQPSTLFLNGGTSTGRSVTIGIVGGALTGMTLPANTAIVADTVAITVPVTGTYATKITPSVNAAGTITGFVLG